MSRHFEAVKVTDKVYWVGAIDWGIRDFHGYTTPRGSTYNAYLIVADDVILIDTVRAPFTEELLASGLGHRPREHQVHHLQPLRAGPL